MRASYQRALGIFVLALIALLLPASNPAMAQKGGADPGACFIYPQGTGQNIFTYPAGYKYHTGCENGGSCGAIEGYDYMAPRGTPVLAPFSGTVTYASQSIGGSPTICSGVDGVGNTVFTMVDEVTGIEFGMLHSTCDGGFQVGDSVEVGQQIATVSDVGQAVGTHAHVWFQDPATGQNIPDHDRFWQCVGGSPDHDADRKFNPGEVEIIGQQSMEELNTFVGLLVQLFTSPSMPSPDVPDEVEKYEFYISHQSSDQNYQYNFIAFFAGHGVEDHPEQIEQKAMEPYFEGYWEIPKGGPYSVNEEFGWGNYEVAQAMKIAPGANGDDYGNGVCNNASILHYVLAESGLLVDADKNTHPPVSGVPAQYLTTVYSPGLDVRITNPFDHPVRLHWAREGDRITLWVEHVGGLRIAVANAQEDLQQLEALYELAVFLSEVDWAGIGGAILSIGVFAFLLWLWTRVFKLKLRSLMVLLAIPMILYAWILSADETWLVSPIESGAEITQYYGDPRRDLTGYTGLTYAVQNTTPVVSVASGRVTTPSNSIFKESQVWVEVGNGLYVQYAQLTTISVEPGEWLNAGEQVGEITAGAELRFGVSSKHPDVFYAADERGFGWLNPEEYLGQTIMSGRRQEESAWTVLGWSLVFLAVFWPGKTVQKLAKILRTDFQYPWDGKRLFRNSVGFVLSFGIFLLGKYLVSPYLISLSKPILIITGSYLVCRETYRFKVKRGTDRNPSNIHIGVYVFVTTIWVARTVIFLGGAIANPSITYAARGGLTLDLPQIVLPGLPSPDELPPWLASVSDGQENQDELIPGWDYNWSPGSSLPEFTTTYWTGSPVRFYAPPELWAAIKRQASKHPACDPRLVLITAQSESPTYTNHVSENYATAAGTWQFIRGTWEWMMPGVPLSGRNDLDLSAEAAFKYLELTGACSATTEAQFVNAFAFNAPVWNQHEGQARFVWRTYIQLRKLMGN